MFLRRCLLALTALGFLALADTALADDPAPPAPAEVPTSASGDYYTHYNQQRNDFPEIDEAIALIPVDGSGEPDPKKIHKELRAISTYLTRPDIIDLQAGDYDLIPGKVQKKLRDKVRKLNDKMEEGLVGLSSDQKYVVLQVMDAQVFSRLQSLYDGHPGYVYCDPNAPECEGPRILNQLDALAYKFTPTVFDLGNAYPSLPNWDASAPAFIFKLDDQYNAMTMAYEIDHVRDTYGSRVPGVPSIDDF